MRINSKKKTAKDTNIPPKIPEVLRSHQEMKNFLQCVPAFKQIKIWKRKYKIVTCSYTPFVQTTTIPDGMKEQLKTPTPLSWSWVIRVWVNRVRMTEKWGEIQGKLDLVQVSREFELVEFYCIVLQGKSPSDMAKLKHKKEQ